MRFSEILSKMVDGQTLSVEEKQTIVQEARRMEENSALLSSIVKPGTKILVLDGVDVTDANVINANIIDAKIVSAEAGDVVLDEFGIFIRYGSIYGITFGDSGGGNRIRIGTSRISRENGESWKLGKLVSLILTNNVAKNLGN